MPLISVPIAAILISQALKVFIEYLKTKKINWSRFNGYGGMPSSHTAFVTSLCIEVILIDGIYSTSFALSFAFLLIVIRDAVGFRRYLGRHSEVINKIVQAENMQKKIPKNLFPLQEILGHTPLQAIMGAVVGALTSLLLHFFIEI